jgi:RNA polymerase sigma-70 factor (ECF subfamily)
MANPAGWVFRVAVNHGRNRHRRRLLERRKLLPPDRDRPDVEAIADPALARVLARLPLDQRTVIVLRFHLDWPIDAIAESLGCAPGTVKSRLHRGLQRLESMLEAPVWPPRPTCRSRTACGPTMPTARPGSRSPASRTTPRSLGSERPLSGVSPGTGGTVTEADMSTRPWAAW